MNPFYVESIALINTFQRHQQGQREPDKKKNPSTFAEILKKEKEKSSHGKTQG